MKWKIIYKEKPMFYTDAPNMLAAKANAIKHFKLGRNEGHALSIVDAEKERK